MRTWNLTPREYDVCQELANGLSKQQIAAKQFRSLRTIEGSIAKLYDKLGFAKEDRHLLKLAAMFRSGYFTRRSHGNTSEYYEAAVEMLKNNVPVKIIQAKTGYSEGNIRRIKSLLKKDVTSNLSRY